MGDRWDVALDKQRGAAAVFGLLVAQDRLSRASALAVLKESAAKAVPDMNAIGRDVRVSWWLHDAVAECAAARERAQFALRRALAPLLEARAPSGTLLAVARSANAAAGNVLTDDEVVDRVRQEVFWTMRRAQRAGAAAARGGA